MDRFEFESSLSFDSFEICLDLENFALSPFAQEIWIYMYLHHKAFNVWLMACNWLHIIFILGRPHMKSGDMKKRQK